ncbi:MAG TPA: hypothetical protein VKM93_19065 [Terriglobia bacterium]|nr:hypothetical protein [Terriglobia bacterium]
MSDVSREPGKAKAARRAAPRVAVLLLLAGLVSVATLAKHSFALPQSSPSHWVSQTCKMSESRCAGSSRVTVLQVVATILICNQPSPTVTASFERDQPPAPIPGFFRHTALRGPPSV